MTTDFINTTLKEYEELLRKFLNSFTAFKAATNRLCRLWDNMDTASYEALDRECLVILSRVRSTKNHLDIIKEIIKEIEKVISYAKQ